jgi:hypothetical protein
MFPIDVSGSIRLRDLGNPMPFVKPVAERIVDMLDEACASEVWRDGNTVRFKRAFLASGPGGNWNILVPFNSGTLRIEIEDMSLRVCYRLSTLRMMLVVTGLVTILFGFVIFSNVKHEGDWRSAAMIAGFGWLWLFGMNYLTGMIRIPFWLKRGLKNTAK